MEQKAKSCYRCGREGHIVRCLHPRFAISSHLCEFGESFSRVIAPNLKAPPAALDPVAVVAVLARNAIAVARSDTLRVRAPRHPEVAQEEATVVVVVEEEEEVMVVLAAAVKKHGALSLASREWY
jgi:hypothetical protein